jgi:hypothetical protein
MTAPQRTRRERGAGTGSPLRWNWQVAVALALVGFAAQRAGLLLHSGPMPRWLQVVAPIAWGLASGGVMLRLAWLERKGRREG